MVDQSKVQQYLNSVCESCKAWWEEPYAFICKINDSTWHEFGLKVRKKFSPGRQEERGKEENSPKPVLTALDECIHRPVLVIGSPGAGKSTFLAKALLVAANRALKDPDAPIPVLVKLNLYESGIWELIQDSLDTYGFDIDVTGIKQLIAEKRLLLLADGVNELPEEKARLKLKEFCRKQIPMIFTTRDLGGDLGIEHKLELQPLSFPEVEQFLRDRLSQQDQKRVQELCDRVRDFGQTPLMVWMLYSVFQGTGKTPTTRGAAYQAFTNIYAEKAKEGIPLEESRPLLEKLAFEMMHSEKLTEPRLDISEVEAQNMLGIKQLKPLWNFHLLQRFEDKRPGNYRIRFCHQSLQEYYAAEALLQKLSDISDYTLKRDYLNYLKWTDAIALMLGLPEITDKQAVRVVKLALKESLGLPAVDLMLGARLAGSVSPRLQQETIRLVQSLEVSEWYKIELLGMTRSEIVVPILCQVLNSGSLDICQRICKWLALLENQTAVPALQQKLFQVNEQLRETRPFSFPNPILLCWEQVIRVLAQLSKEDAISDLRRKLLGSLDPLGRFTSFCDGTTLLAQLDGKNCLPKLFELVEDQNSPRHREVAVNILGKIDDEAALSKLIQRLALEKEPIVLNSIIDALGASKNNKAALALVRMIEDPNPTIRKYAVEKLIVQNNPVVISELEPFLDHSDWDISWNTAKVLGHLGSTTALTKLIPCLIDKYCEIHIRSTAAKVLGELGNDEAILVLLNELADSDYLVRRNVAIALGKFCRKDAVPELLRAFRHYYPSNYQDLDVYASIRIGDHPFKFKGIADEDLELLGDDNAKQRWCWEQSTLGRVQMEIAEVLDHLDTEEAIKGLFGGLDNPIYFSAQTAAIILGRRGFKEAIPQLLELIKKVPTYISTNSVINILASLADETVISELIRVLKNIEEYAHSDFYLRNRVAIILGRTRSELTSKYLSELKELTSSVVVEQVLWSILGIQASCKFYNYEIAQSAAEEGRRVSGVGCGEETQVINNIYNVGLVGNFNAGEVTIQGNQVGESHQPSDLEGETQDG